jgi:hypothetical protein
LAGSVSSFFFLTYRWPCLAHGFENVSENLPLPLREEGPGLVSSRPQKKTISWLVALCCEKEGKKKKRLQSGRGVEVGTSPSLS